MQKSFIIDLHTGSKYASKYSLAKKLLQYNEFIMSRTSMFKVGYVSRDTARWWPDGGRTIKPDDGRSISRNVSHFKHTYSWSDKLIVLWILNRQAKIFLRIKKLLPKKLLGKLERNLWRNIIDLIFYVKVK